MAITGVEVVMAIASMIVVCVVTCATLAFVVYVLIDIWKHHDFKKPKSKCSNKPTPSIEYLAHRKRTIDSIMRMMGEASVDYRFHPYSDWQLAIEALDSWGALAEGKWPWKELLSQVESHHSSNVGMLRAYTHPIVLPGGCKGWPFDQSGLPDAQEAVENSGACLAYLKKLPALEQERQLEANTAPARAPTRQMSRL